jgi:Na+/H+-translocating membrane pyrophosphatase
MLAIVPDEFTFGAEGFPVLFKEGITAAKFMGCGMLGLLLNMLILGLFELITSHGFDSVRDLTRAADSAPTLNVIAAYANAYK